MVIVIIGGPERAVGCMRLLAEAHGHRLEHHDGDWSNQRKRSLEGMIGRADLVVIVTGVNSHAAVVHARTLARRGAIPSLICRRFGLSNLDTLLAALAVRRERAGHPGRDSVPGKRRIHAAALACSSLGTFALNAGLR